MRGRRLPASLPLLLVLAGLFAIGGCSSSSFVGRRFDNFTAYYNTFYNAKKAYREGIKAQEERDAPIDRDAYLSVFTVPERSGSGGSFNEAIQKSADVLRKHDASKWADDALLLIGTSYFYQQNYVGAEQKFREVIGLDGRFENSPLKDEARFWLARTLIASGAYEEAAAHLEETLRSEDLPRRWEGRLRLALGELQVKQGAWEAAAAELEEGLRLVRDDELSARAQFLLGQVLETLGNYEAAAEAFEGVRRYDPLFELAYAAQISALRVNGLHGDAEAALDRLRRMERDDKYYDRRAELAYLRARIYQAEGRAREARNLYRALLYDGDADLNLQAVRGRVHYGLGTLYRDALDDYFLAAAHFDTAATALSPGVRRGGGFGGQDEALMFTAEALTDGAEQARVFGNFASIMADVSRMDSLLYLGGLDDAAFEEAILEIRRQRAEELAAQQRLLAERQARQRFSGEDVDYDEEFEDEEFEEDLDADDVDEDSVEGTQSASTSAGSTAGFLFHRSPAKVQEGRLLFFDRWGERPLVPNWRRSGAIASEKGALADNEKKLRQLKQLGINPRPQLEESGLPDVDVSDVPRDAESQRAMQADRAAARYELANVLFLQMNRPDSAAAWYRKVIEEDAEHSVAQRAYYALAEVQQALGDTASAEGIYREMLAGYPDSEFAGRIRQRLGLSTEAAARPDSARLAEDAYRQAFRQWERGAYRRALREMLDVAAQYRRTPVAPKALTAAGSIYAEWARRDGRDPLAPLLLRLPDRLLKEAGLLEEAGLPDSTRTAARFLDAPPTAAFGDSLAAVSDSVLVAADSLLADSLLADIRPSEERESAPLHLETLYASVARNYPQSPYAERARQVLEAIGNLRPQVEVNLAIGPGATLLDSSASTGASQTATVAEEPPQAAFDDSEPALRERTLLEEKKALREAREAALAANEREAEDNALLDEELARRRQEREAQGGLPEHEPDEKGLRTRGEQAPTTGPDSTDHSSVRSDAPAEATSRLPEADAAVERGIDPAQGGWSIVVASGTDSSSVRASFEPYATRLRTRELPTGIIVGETNSTVRYRALAGQYASRADAQAALEGLAEELPKDAWLIRVRSEK